MQPTHFIPLGQFNSSEDGMMEVECALFSEVPEQAPPHDAHELPINGNMTLSSVEICEIPNSQNVRIRFQTHEFDTLLRKAIENPEIDPVARLAVLGSDVLPTTQAQHLQVQTLDAITESSRKELERLQLEQITSQGDESYDFDLYSSATAYDSELNQLKAESKAKLLEKQKEWKKHHKILHDETVKLMFDFYNEFDAHQEAYQKLVSLNPSSFIPHIPFLTMMLQRLTLNQLRAFISEAKKLDPVLTYTLVSTHVKTLFMRAGRGNIPYNAREIIQALLDSYPNDQLAKNWLDSLGSEAISLDLISHHSEIQEAISAVLSGSHLSPYHFESMISRLPGIADFYQLKALAAICSSRYEDAKLSLQEALKVPSLSEPNSGQYFSMLYKFMRVNKNCPEPPVIRDFSSELISSIIQLHDKESQCITKKVSEIFQLSTQALEKGLYPLIYVYCAVKEICKRAPLVNRMEIDESCVKLLQLIATLAVRCGSTDEWLLERVEINDNGFTLLFDRVTFGAPLTFPEVEVEPGLELTPNSKRELLNATFKELYQYYLGNLLQETYIADHCAQFQTLLPADSSGIALHCLTDWFRNPTPEKIQLARKWMDELSYKFDPEICEWLSFALELYAPSKSDEAEEMFSKVSSVQKAISNNRTNETSLKVLISTVLRTKNQLDRRSASGVRTVEVKKTNTLRALLNVAHQKFGWKQGEPLQEWRNRLAREREAGQTAAPLRRLQIGGAQIFAKSDVRLSGDLGNAWVIEVIRTCRDFWIEFCDVTISKNDVIQNSDLEDGEKAHDHNWYRLPRADWVKVVRHKDGAKTHPNYNQFSPTQRQALENIVKEKKHHDSEVNALKKPSKRGSTAVTVAALVENIEYKRDDNVPHSVYLPSQEEAEAVYRLAMEVSFQRLVDHFFLKLGPTKGTHADLKVLIQLLRDHVIGAFHGPESHLFGKGPLQNHYNAGIVPTSGESAYNTSINTHIYYPNGSS